MQFPDKIKLGAHEVSVSEMSTEDCIGEQRSGIGLDCLVALDRLICDHVATSESGEPSA